MTMVVGAALLFAGTIAPAVGGGAPLLLVGRILQGIGFFAATTAAATAASDILPESRLGEGLGYYGLGQALALSLGPAVALFLVGADPAENLFAGMAAVAALAVVFALLSSYESNPMRLPKTSAYRIRFEESRAGRGDGVACLEDDGASAAGSGGSPLRKWKEIFEPKALPGTLTLLVISPAFGFGLFFMGLYGTTLGISNPGLFYTVSAASMVAIRLAAKVFMDRVASIKVMAAAAACGIVAFALALLASENSALFFLAGIPYGACQGVVIPLNQAVTVRNTPPERWGSANAQCLLANDVGIGIASLIWGALSDSLGFHITILGVMACVALSLVVAWLVYPASEKKRRGEDPEMGDR